MDRHHCCWADCSGNNGILNVDASATRQGLSIMASDWIGEELFEDLVTAFLQDVTGVLVPGVRVATVLVGAACRAFSGVLNKGKKSDRPAKMDAVAGVQFSQSYDIAQRKVDETDFDEDQKASLVNYLSAIPMTSRQAIHRWNDGGRVTTLVSQVPQNTGDMEHFVPIRPLHFQPGHKIPGYDYRLVELLGQGGFSEVWKAQNTELDSQAPRAFKFCIDEELLPSFKQEIQMMDELQKRSPEKDSPEKDFVRLIDTAYNADPPFLVYEYIDGGNLTGWLESFEGKAPKPDDVISVMKMTARAMAVAHDNEIVHRDLKPSNLLMTRDGRVKVADFGIGTQMAESEARKGGGQGTEAANLSMIHGASTPMYSDSMRDRSAKPDPQDDVYAMGVIAYQLLIGSVTRRMEGGWKPHLESRGVPDRLIEVIETCVAPSEQRFSNAGALLHALESPQKAVKPKSRTSRKGTKRTKRAGVEYCHQCGVRVQRGNQYCNNCGYRYDDSTAHH